MDPYDHSRVADAALLHSFLSDAGDERCTIARVVAKIAEIDARKLYRDAGYPSMFTYCVDVAHYSEGEAYKRISVARTARRFPQVFPALADGRLNLSGVILLASRLTHENAAELIAQAAGKTNAEITELLAARFPSTELLPMVMSYPASVSPESDAQLSVRRVVGIPAADSELNSALAHPAAAPTAVPPVATPLPAARSATLPPPKLTPIAAARFGFQFSTGQATHDKFRYGQALANCTDLEQNSRASKSRSSAPPRARASAQRAPARTLATFRERSGARCGAATGANARS